MSESYGDVRKRMRLTDEQEAMIRVYPRFCGAADGEYGTFCKYQVRLEESLVGTYYLYCPYHGGPIDFEQTKVARKGYPMVPTDGV